MNGRSFRPELRSAVWSKWHAPPALRLWVVGTGVLLLTPMGDGLRACLCVLVMILAWEEAKQLASCYGPTEPSFNLRRSVRRLLRFSSSALVTAIALAGFIDALDAVIGMRTDHLPILVFALTLSVGWLCLVMIRSWWRFTYVVLGSAIIASVGILIIPLAIDNDKSLSFTGQVGQNLCRLVLVFMSAELIAIVEQKGWLGVSLASFGYAPFFVVGLAVLDQPMPFFATAQPWQQLLWLAIAVFVLIAVILNGMRYREAFTFDSRWIVHRHQARLGLARSIPLCWFVVLAWLPAVVCSATTGWYAWSALYTLGLAASLLAWRAEGRRPRRHVRELPEDPFVFAHHQKSINGAAGD